MCSLECWARTRGLSSSTRLLAGNEGSLRAALRPATTGGRPATTATAGRRALRSPGPAEPRSWIDPPELTSSWHGEHVQVGERVRFRPAARPGTCMGMSMDTRALQKGLAESGRRPGTSTGALRPQGARGTRGRE